VHKLSVILLFVVFSTSMWSQTPQPDEITIGPVIATENIQGIPVNIPVTAFLKLATDSAGISVNLRLAANLSDLQQKIGSIIDTAPLPHNVCDHFGVDNIVARIWGKQLNASPNQLTLKLNGDVDDWTCVKNPVPCSKVTWGGGFIKYPQITLYDCNSPIENKNINQPFEANLSTSLQVVDPQTVSVVLGNPSVNLGGKLGGVTQGILNIAGVNLNQKASDALKQAVDPAKLRQALPPDIQSLNLAITDAHFSNENGQGFANLGLSGKIPANQVTVLFQTLLAKPAH